MVFSFSRFFSYNDMKMACAISVCWGVDVRPNLSKSMSNQLYMSLWIAWYLKQQTNELTTWVWFHVMNYRVPLQAPTVDHLVRVRPHVFMNPHFTSIPLKQQKNWHPNQTPWEILKAVHDRIQTEVPYLSQICRGVRPSSKALVSVAVPYSSVPHMKITL